MCSTWCWVSWVYFMLCRKQGANWTFNYSLIKKTALQKLCLNYREKQMCNLSYVFPTDWPIIPFRKRGNPGPIQSDCLWPDCDGSLHSSFPASIALFFYPSFILLLSKPPFFPSFLLSNFNCPGKVMVGPQGTKLWFLMNVPVRGLWAAMGSRDVRSCDRKGMILYSDLSEKVESNR